jgi:hypothetical protein
MSSVQSSYREARMRWRRMDRLVRMMIVNWLGGMVVGLVCAFALLALDVAGVRSLLWRSDMPVVGTLMLAAVFAFTFGGLVCAAAVMMSGDDDRRPPRGGRKLRPVARRQLAFAAAGARRSH